MLLIMFETYSEYWVKQTDYDPVFQNLIIENHTFRYYYTIRFQKPFHQTWTKTDHQNCKHKSSLKADSNWPTPSIDLLQQSKPHMNWGSHSLPQFLRSPWFCHWRTLWHALLVSDTFWRLGIALGFQFPEWNSLNRPLCLGIIYLFSYLSICIRMPNVIFYYWYLKIENKIIFY